MLHAIERVHGGGPRFTGQLRTARTAGLRRTFALQHRPGMAKVRPKRAFASAPRASEFPPLMMWAVAIAASIGAGTGCIVLTSQGGYALDRLRSPQSQMWPTLKAVVLAASAVITCLSSPTLRRRHFAPFPSPLWRARYCCWQASGSVSVHCSGDGRRPATFVGVSPSSRSTTSARNLSSGCRRNRTHSKS